MQWSGWQKWAFLFIAVMLGACSPAHAEDSSPSLSVPRTGDFEIDGTGTAAAWNQASWQSVPHRKGPLEYRTRFKLMYSERFLYLLFDNADAKLTADIQEDFQNLWEQDVVEAFFWTDEAYPLYFEYEISPLGKELPILVPNLNSKFLGWLPWHYEDVKRRIQKAVSVRGGPQTSGAAIQGWTAEIKIPYDLLKPLTNVPPVSGTIWKANFYRMDYDEAEKSTWTWSPVEKGFHDYRNFGTLKFE